MGRSESSYRKEGIDLLKWVGSASGWSAAADLSAAKAGAAIAPR